VLAPLPDGERAARAVAGHLRINSIHWLLHEQVCSVEAQVVLWIRKATGSAAEKWTVSRSLRKVDIGHFVERPSALSLCLCTNPFEGLVQSCIRIIPQQAPGLRII
jgi:hypothetical protein